MRVDYHTRPEFSPSELLCLKDSTSPLEEEEMRGIKD